MSAELIMCEPRKDCADANVMRGHDGAEPNVCPLTVCDRRGANRSSPVQPTDEEG